jgi:hypothetical protein
VRWSGPVYLCLSDWLGRNAARDPLLSVMTLDRLLGALEQVGADQRRV